MHLSLSRFFFFLAVVRGAVSLGIQYDKPESSMTAQEKQNKGRLDKAIEDANEQLGVTRICFERYAYKADPAATKLYQASFGLKADQVTVGKTIKALEDGILSVEVATHVFGDDTIASVPWTQQQKYGPWIAGPAMFSSHFHGQGSTPRLNNHGRTATVIHEASHQLAKTGDEVNLSGNIIRPYDDNSKPTGKTGYTSNPDMHTTIAEVDQDTEFVDVRDTVKNMQINAESYALFASLCYHNLVVTPLNPEFTMSDFEQEPLI